MLALLIVTVCSLTGCMHRRMTIRSSPPGAFVYVENREIGVTPCATDFTYYGTREFRLVKAGYETLVVKRTFNSPWYQIPPLDFFSDNFAFQEIRDERIVDFQLSPQQIIPTNILMDRAQQLRGNAQQGYVVPLNRPEGMIGGLGGEIPEGAERLPTPAPTGGPMPQGGPGQWQRAQ